MRTHEIGMGAERDLHRTSSLHLPLGVLPTSPLEIISEIEALRSLDDIADDPKVLNGVEGMLHGNPQIQESFVRLVEASVRHIGDATHFLLSSLADSLINESHEYATLKNEEAKPKFYARLNQMLDAVSANLAANSNEGTTPYVNRATLKALNLVKLAVMFKDAHDTYRHMSRVGDDVDAIYRHFGVPEIKRKAGKASGKNHDVGKILIPEQILNKKGKLTTEEKAIVDRHSEDGVIILDRILPDLPERDLILYLTRWHHEESSRVQHELKLGAMITCDVYDACRSDRPYRRAMTQEQARDEMKEMLKAGKLHPDVYKAIFVDGILKRN